MALQPEAVVAVGHLFWNAAGLRSHWRGEAARPQSLAPPARSRARAPRRLAPPARRRSEHACDPRLSAPAFSRRQIPGLQVSLADIPEWGPLAWVVLPSALAAGAAVAGWHAVFAWCAGRQRGTSPGGERNAANVQACSPDGSPLN